MRSSRCIAVSFGTTETAIGLLWSVGVAGRDRWFFWTQGHWFERLSMHNWLVLAAGGVGAALCGDGGVRQLHGRAAADATHCTRSPSRPSTPPCIPLVRALSRPSARPRPGAVHHARLRPSGVVGGVAGGALSERWGFPAVFWAASAAALLSALCLLRSRRHADRPQRPAWRFTRAAGRFVILCRSSSHGASQFVARGDRHAARFP